MDIIDIYAAEIYYHSWNKSVGELRPMVEWRQLTDKIKC